MTSVCMSPGSMVPVHGIHQRHSGPQSFLPGAPIALCKQTEEILTALVIGQNRMHVTWVEGNGTWQEPIAFSPLDFPNPSGVALCKQTDNVLTALAVTTGGQFSVAWVEGTDPWHAPEAFGPARFAAGAPVALCSQSEDVLTAVLVDTTGTMNVTWVEGTGAWQGPEAFRCRKTPDVSHVDRCCPVQADGDHPDGTSGGYRSTASCRLG